MGVRDDRQWQASRPSSLGCSGVSDSPFSHSGLFVGTESVRSSIRCCEHGRPGRLDVCSMGQACFCLFVISGLHMPGAVRAGCLCDRSWRCTHMSHCPMCVWTLHVRLCTAPAHTSGCSRCAVDTALVRLWRECGLQSASQTKPFGWFSCCCGLHHCFGTTMYKMPIASCGATAIGNSAMSCCWVPGQVSRTAAE